MTTPSEFRARLDQEMEFALQYFSGFDPDADIQTRQAQIEQIIDQKQAELAHIVDTKQEGSERAVSEMIDQIANINIKIFQDERKDLSQALPQRIETLVLAKEDLLKALDTGKKERQVQNAQKVELVRSLQQLRLKLKSISHVGFSERTGPRKVTQW